MCYLFFWDGVECVVVSCRVNWTEGISVVGVGRVKLGGGTGIVVFKRGGGDDDEQNGHLFQKRFKISAILNDWINSIKEMIRCVITEIFRM